MYPKFRTQFGPVSGVKTILRFPKHNGGPLQWGRINFKPVRIVCSDRVNSRKALQEVAWIFDQFAALNPAPDAIFIASLSAAAWEIPFARGRR
jgi:hypothetical protein